MTVTSPPPPTFTAFVGDLRELVKTGQTTGQKVR